MGQYGDLIGIAIAVVLMVGSGVVNWLRQVREKAEAERQQRERMEQVQLRTQLPRDTPAAPTLDDVAAQRREQLRQLAQQRQRATGGSPAGGQVPQPTNLTMAERIARARAKEQYAQRAEALKQQGRAASATPSDAAAQRTAAETARQQARIRAEREAQRAGMERQRRAAEQAQRAAIEAKQRAQQKLAQQQQRARANTAPRPGTAPRGVQASAAPVAAAAAETSNRLAQAPMRLLGGRGQGGVQLAFDRQSIRHAIIMKEILDRPLALRGPSDASSF